LSAIRSISPVPSLFVLEFVWRSLRSKEDIGSRSEVNRLVGELVRQCLPSVDFAWWSDQRRAAPRTTCRVSGRGQHGLGLTYSFDRENNAVTPYGGKLAGRYDVRMLCVAAGSPNGYDTLHYNWDLGGREAAEQGRVMDRVPTIAS
jgi:hypothetical protein